MRVGSNLILPPVGLLALAGTTLREMLIRLLEMIAKKSDKLLLNQKNTSKIVNSWLNSD